MFNLSSRVRFCNLSQDSPRASVIVQVSAVVRNRVWELRGDSDQVFHPIWFQIHTPVGGSLRVEGEFCIRQRLEASYV